MKSPDYSFYGFRELYEALDRLRGDIYPEALAALEAEIARRENVEKPLLEEVFFRLDRERFPEHEKRLRRQIEKLGGFDSIAPESVTPENLFKTGWRRFWAVVFDVVFVTLLLMPMTAIVLGGREDDLALTGAVEFIQQTLSVFYYVLMHAACGQTLGKMITGVKVVRNSDFSPIRLRHALLRDIVPLLAIFLGLLSMPYFDFGIGEGDDLASVLPVVFIALVVVHFAWPFLELLTMLLNRRRRALHDYIAGTVVIRYLRTAEKSRNITIPAESAATQ
ncbi:MAG: RDD family protein [Gammaproteobacteria bacterium]|nr:RDD family protein [Gammaproteobacteria bacterium]